MATAKLRVWEEDSGAYLDARGQGLERFRQSEVIAKEEKKQFLDLFRESVSREMK